MTQEPLNIEALRARLHRVEAELAETLRRMPAHSVKPALMAVLLDLEDERDRLLDRIGKHAENLP